MKIEDISAVLFDLDGTVYYGSSIIDGANDTIEFFRRAGKAVYFTTNNSTKTRRQIFDRLTGMGVNCRYEEVLTSGYLAASYAKKRGMNNIFIFGSEDLKEEFRGMGIPVNESEDAENLLIGYNPKMTYEQLTAAVNVALHAKIIIACNRERVFPGENRRLLPGCGAMTAPIEWCANRECDLIIGKPNTFLADYLVDTYGYEYRDLLVIGDTYESDVAMANVAGCPSVLISKKSYGDTVTVEHIRDVPGLF